MGIADMLDELEIKEPLPSYSPTLYRITGGKGEAVALAQLIYKCSNCNWGTVRMSSTDWANELQLSRREFENLNQCIIQLGLGTAEVCYLGYVKKIAYTLDKKAIINALKDGNVRYDVRNKLRNDTLEVTYSNVTNDVPIRNKLPISTSEVAPIKEYKSNKSKEDIKEAFTETSSVVPKLFKSELMQQALEAGIENNSAAKPKSKKPKAELSEIDKEIRDKVKYIANNFKLWHDKNKEIVYLHKDSDFVQLTKLFKQLCKKEGYTTDQVIADLNLIVSKFDKLPHFYQSNFNLTYIATNYQKLLLEIKNPKPAPVIKPNYNEPVPYVHKRLPQYYDGYTLPLGITAMQFEQLAELVMREKIMEGLIDENLRLSGFCQMYRIELHKITEEQLTQLMKDYEII
jgi:hypothetical protein